MATYADLRNDIANEAIRPNLSAEIPGFVRRATQRINRDVRVADMEKRARSPGNGTNYLPSPLGFLEMRRLWNITGTNARNAITQVSPQALRPKPAGGDTPKFFSVGGGTPPELEFDSALGTGLTVEMIYLRAYDYFANDADTNWVLDNAYDLYMEGSLYYLYKFDRNNEEAAMRAAGYKAALDELNRAERRQMYMQPIFTTAGHNVV